jgi:hypothetical protein
MSGLNSGEQSFLENKIDDGNSLSKAAPPCTIMLIFNTPALEFFFGHRNMMRTQRCDAQETFYD